MSQTPVSPPRQQVYVPADPRGWRRWLPGLQLIRQYRREWLPRDLLAGLVLTAMLVPVGIAYAEAAGIPGIYGLYATIVPLLAYALFGPSRILVLGPDSSLVALILAVVVPLSQGDPAKAVVLGSAMALIAGLICIAGGMLKLGFVTELLSKPIRYGYMNGIALAVIISQLPTVLGFSIDTSGPLANLLAMLDGIVNQQLNWVESLLGAGTLAVILGLKRFPRVPGILIAVTLATLITGLFDLAERSGVKILGSLPQGLPAFTVPWISAQEWQAVFIGAFAVALIAFADTSVLSRTYAARTRHHVDPNQEMIGLGVANVAAGFFQGFPVSSSSSRTPVAEAAGAQTQLACVVGALTVTLLLVLAPDLLSYLPASALAAVVVASALSLFEIRDLRRIYRIQNWEFWLSMACFAGVLILGVIPGIGLAIVISVIEFLWDGWRPHHAVLGQVDGIRGFHDITRYPDARQIPGLLLFRWDAPLFFANAEQFQTSIFNAITNAPTPVKRIVVTAEPVTSVDVTSADMLAELREALRNAGIELHFAELKDRVKDKIRQFELMERLGEDVFHPTVSAAVEDYLRTYGITWPQDNDHVFSDDGLERDQ